MLIPTLGLRRGPVVQYVGPLGPFSRSRGGALSFAAESSCVGLSVFSWNRIGRRAVHAASMALVEPGRAWRRIATNAAVARRSAAVRTTRIETGWVVTVHAQDEDDCLRGAITLCPLSGARCVRGQRGWHATLARVPTVTSRVRPARAHRSELGDESTSDRPPHPTGTHSVSPDHLTLYSSTNSNSSMSDPIASTSAPPSPPSSSPFPSVQTSAPLVDSYTFHSVDHCAALSSDKGKAVAQRDAGLSWMLGVDEAGRGPVLGQSGGLSLQSWGAAAELGTRARRDASRLMGGEEAGVAG